MAHKETTYPELARQNQYGKLTVLACEMGGLMASQSPHDGFEAHRGQDADDSTVATASSSTGVSSTMVGNPLDGAPTHKCYESLGSPWYGGDWFDVMAHYASLLHDYFVSFKRK